MNMGLFDPINPFDPFDLFGKKKKNDQDQWIDISSSDRFRRQGSSNWVDHEDWRTDDKPAKSGGFDIYEDNDF